MCLVAWYLFFEICRLFLCLRYNQNLIFFCEFHIIRIYKKFLFRVCSILFHNVVARGFFCGIAPRFYWKRIFRRGFMEVFVGSESASDYFNIQKSWCYYSIVCCVCLWVFFIGRLCGLFVVVVLVIDFTIDWWDSLLGLFWRFVFWMFLIEWLCGLIVVIVWCNFVLVFYWTVVILWERRKIMVGRCIAMLPLLNLMSKWVRSDSNGWSFDLDVYCLLWKRFCVLNVVLRAAQVNRLLNRDTVLALKKTQRVVRPCFNCVAFMAQTVAA